MNYCVQCSILLVYCIVYSTVCEFTIVLRNVSKFVKNVEIFCQNHTVTAGNGSNIQKMFHRSTVLHICQFFALLFPDLTEIVFQVQIHLMVFVGCLLGVCFCIGLIILIFWPIPWILRSIFCRLRIRNSKRNSLSKNENSLIIVYTQWKSIGTKVKSCSAPKST